MGMLMYHQRQKQRHEDAVGTSKAPRKRAKRGPKAKAPVVEPGPGPSVSPYADLTDEQVAEAYATNVAGEAEGREAQQAELEALDAENESHED